MIHSPLPVSPGMGGQPLPNPYDTGYQYHRPNTGSGSSLDPRRPSSSSQLSPGANQPQRAPSFASRTPPPPPSHANRDADLEAALAASQASALEEQARRRQEDEEELRKLADLHRQEQEQQQRRNQQAQLEEDELLRRAMEESRAEEERWRREAQERERKALEESRLEAEREAERRRKVDEEELQRAMEASLREEWERRREAEEEERRLVDRMRAEIEAEQRTRAEQSRRPAVASYRNSSPAEGRPSASGTSYAATQRPAAAPSVDAAPRSRRPLPVPGHQQPTTSLESTVQPSPLHSVEVETRSASSSPDRDGHDDVAEYDDQDDGDDPFADTAEAPPAYENVGTDRPPEAPERAPTGFWDETRARRIREQRAAGNVSSEAPAATDPVEEKRRAEAAGRATAEAERQMAMPSTTETTSNDEPSTSRLAAVPVRVASLSPSVRARKPLPSPEAHTDAASEVQDTTALERPRPQRDESDNSVVSTTSRSTAHFSPSDVETSTEAESSSAGQRRESVSSTKRPIVGQSTPIGIDWGYSDIAFGMKLRSGPRSNFYRGRRDSNSSQVDDETSQDETDASLNERFPNIITLTTGKTKAKAVLNGETSSLTSQSSPYFTIRCGSWRLLLRSLAWLGNSIIEASPQEVADAADQGQSPLLRVEVEFVTPPKQGGSGGKSAAAYGLEEFPSGATLQEVIEGARDKLTMRPTACVSLCLSLLLQQDQHASQHAERELDMEYLKRGSSRTVLNLPPSCMGLGPALSSFSMSYYTDPAQVQRDTQKGLTLPTSVIKMAEYLQRAHRFSAACPSSGYTARHSPRDLYHMITSHDDKFISKSQQQAAAMNQDLSASLPSSPLDGERPGSSGFSAVNASKRVVPLASVFPGGPPLLLWDDQSILAASAGQQQPSLSQLQLDGTVSGERSGRLRDKVKRKLRGRQGEVGQDDLASWITPLDLSESQ